jgi:hypothetical protein
MTKLRGELVKGTRLKLFSRDTVTTVVVESVEKVEKQDCVVFIRIERVDDDCVDVSGE